MNYDFHSRRNRADFVRNGEPDRPNKGHDITIGKSRARFDAGIRPSLAELAQSVRQQRPDGVARQLQVLRERLREMFHARLLRQACRESRSICACLSPHPLPK